MKLEELRNKKESEKKRREFLVSSIKFVLTEVTWKELAKIMGIHYSLVSRIKTNTLPMSAKKVEEYINKLQ